MTANAVQDLSHSFVSSFDMSTANWLQYLLCAAAQTDCHDIFSSATPSMVQLSHCQPEHLCISSGNPQELQLRPSSMCLADKVQLGVEGHPAVRACMMCVLHFD